MGFICYFFILYDAWPFLSYGYRVARIFCGLNFSPFSLRGRRLKGKGKEVLGKGVLGAREKRGAREEGGRETPGVSLPPFLLARPSRFAFRVSPFLFPFKRQPGRLFPILLTDRSPPIWSKLCLIKWRFVLKTASLTRPHRTRRGLMRRRV